MIVKVVYFDEGSATDYIHIINKGESAQLLSKITNRVIKIAGKAQAKIKAGIKLPLFGASASADGEAGAEREGTTIIKKTITNTILTDYLKEVFGKKDNAIRIFNDYLIEPYPESFAYYKMITPYGNAE